MSESVPSKTCLYVAAGRALGEREPDEAVRNPDWFCAAARTLRLFIA
jgi:hypothetical protein